MYFFCEDVKVYNYEYYCHCSHNPHPKGAIKRKTKPPRIDIISSNNHSQQTKQTKQSVVSQKQPSTLLQRIRLKHQSTSGFQATKLKSKENNCFKPTIADQSIPLRVEGGFDENRGSDLFEERVGSANFSFCLPKQVLISHTFNEECPEEENCVEQESQVVQPSLAGKFRRIQCLFSNQKYQQHLAFDSSIGFLVSVKVFLDSISEEIIYRELQTYNKLGRHQNILELYQICFDLGKATLVKQPHSNQQPTLANKEQISNDISKGLSYMGKMGLHFKKLHLSDIKNCFGIWKIANFQNVSSSISVPIDSLISELLSQIK